MILFVKLLLAHIAGDFLLQPDAWVLEKEKRKHRSLKLYLHVILHGLLAWLIVWDATFWLPVVAIIVSHYAIDLAKVSLQKPNNRALWFVIDQVLHVAMIAIIWYTWTQPELSSIRLPLEQTLIIVTAAILLTSPTSTIIRMTISHWTPVTLHSVSASLPDAGKFIGYLERLLVLLFILFHHWEAVGFLLAAKSVFRFGDLRESHDRKLTEYVLIGTLLSFAIALVIALLTLYMLH